MVDALDFRSGGRPGSNLVVSLDGQETLLHIVSLHPGV